MLYVGYTYTKTLFSIFLKITLYKKSYILPRNPETANMCDYMNDLVIFLYLEYIEQFAQVHLQKTPLI